MKLSGACLVLFTLTVAGCMDFKQVKTGGMTLGQVEPPSTVVSSPSFSDIQKYVLKPSCIQCHGSSNPSAGISLTSYAAVLSTVNPKNPQGSALYTVIATGNMPKGAAQLSDAMITEVYNWIKAGALEASAPMPTPPTPIPTSTLPPPPSALNYAAIQKAVLTPHCISCHGSSGGVSLTSYASVLKTVNPGSPQGSSLYTAIATGNMPRGGSQLSSTLVNEVYDWIKAGAPQK
jgi:mono/diheme cytochrome c family protein